MHRRSAIGILAASLAGTALPRATLAAVPTPYDWSASPPFDDRQAFIDWMVKNRGEDPGYLGERYDRFPQLIAHHDVWDDRNKRAFLMVPRERFVAASNLARARLLGWHAHSQRQDLTDLRGAPRKGPICCPEGPR